MTANSLPEWTSFEDANPTTAKSIFIKLRDGRELRGAKYHTDLYFDGVATGELKASHWDMQLEATHWKYI
jgi:hypothetical protein